MLVTLQEVLLIKDAANFPHGKVERKARLILDCSVFRAVDQHIHSMASTRAGEEEGSVSNDHLLSWPELCPAICCPLTAGGFLRPGIARLEGFAGG
jgi:hypothetical protein